MAIISRRGILRGLFAVPAIVAASSLMPVRGLILPPDLTAEEIISLLDNRLDEGHQFDLYPGNDRFVRHGSYEDIEHRLGIGLPQDHPDVIARAREAVLNDYEVVKYRNLNRGHNG